MIPRAKVNYGFTDLLAALTISSAGDRHRARARRFLQTYLGMDRVWLTPSGRGALYFLLRSEPRPRVVVPAYTCNAVIEAAALAGKEVSYVEVEEDGFNMDVAQLENAIDAETIVVATHQFGIPCDIERCVEVSHRRGALVIEDAAASLGTRVAGRLTGTFADAAFFSFDSTKLVNVPLKGGAAVVRDEVWFERFRETYAAETEVMPWMLKLRLLILGLAYLSIEPPLVYRFFHWLYFERRGIVTAESRDLQLEHNLYYRYDFADWQASIAVKQLEQLGAIVEKRRELYARFRQRLLRCRAFAVPPEDAAREWACIRFPIRIKGDKLAYYRRALEAGIDFAFSFTHIVAPRSFRLAHNLADAVLDLPFYFKLTPGEFERVCEALEMFDRAPIGGEDECSTS